ERNEIAQRNGADVVDMETEIIAQACAARQIPLLSLRVITDTPSEPLPAPPNVLFDIERQKINVAKFSWYFLKHPTQLRRLIEFSGQIKCARKNLSNALVTLLQSGL